MENKYKLEIKDIQAIHYAEIEIDGISAVIGENNLGKSTVNKILYSLVKASNHSKEDQSENFTSNIIKKFFKDKDNKSIDIIMKKISGEDVELSNVENEIYKNIIDLVGNSGGSKKETYFSNIFLNELSAPIVNNGYDFGEIILYKNDKIIYHIYIEDQYGGIKFNEKVNRLKELEYEDVTYIEISDILPLYPVWGEMLTSTVIKNSTKDMIRKAMKFQVDNSNDNIDSLVYINGRLLYRTNDNGIVKFVNINNIGDGYKRLSLMKSLINNKIIRKNTLLLLEEPEVGIHPKKIEEVVKIIRNLSKEIDIVFTTHDNLIVNNFIGGIKIFKADGDNNSLLACKSIIKHCNKSEEILNQYIESLTQLRKNKKEDKYRYFNIKK